MGCQKDIAARIRAKGADYLLALKANHSRAFETVRGHFERTCFSRGCGGQLSTPLTTAMAAWPADASCEPSRRRA